MGLFDLLAGHFPPPPPPRQHIMGATTRTPKLIATKPAKAYRSKPEKKIARKPKRIAVKPPAAYGINRSMTPTGLLGSEPTNLMDKLDWLKETKGSYDYSKDADIWSERGGQYYTPEGKFDTIEERLNYYKKTPRHGYDILQAFDEPMRNKFISLRDRVKRELGLEIQIIEGYRTPERQNELFDKGITKARGGRSKHQSGRAFDFNFFPYQDKEEQMRSGDFKAVADIAKKMGFKWSGDWKDLDKKELGHLEWTTR